MQSRIQENWTWNLKKSELAVLFATNDILKLLLSQMKTPLDLAMVSQVCCSFYNTIAVTPSLKELYDKQNKMFLSFFKKEKLIATHEVRDNTPFSQIRLELNINQKYTFYAHNKGVIKDDTSPKDHGLIENSIVSYEQLMMTD